MKIDFKQYVLVFAQDAREKILFIQKARPAWMQGRLNLPGGHIEPGETPIAAAVRELLEETNLKAFFAKELGTLESEDFRVHVIKVHAHTFQARALTDEPIEWLSLIRALADPRLIPNLKLIIPLCLAGVENWTITPTDYDPFSQFWNVHIPCESQPT